MLNFNKTYFAAIALLSVIFTGCIKNDLPYPQIQANFLTFEIEGALRNADIDSTDMELTLFLEETTDIRNVVVKSYSLTPKATISGVDLSKPLDLTNDLHATLTLYQEYEWTISAVQNIERYFTVKSQIGASVINADNHTVDFVIPDNIDIRKVEVLTMKLGPTGSTVSDNLAGKTVDFSAPVKIDITNFGITTTWTLTATTSNAPVVTAGADAWTNVLWVYGEGQEGEETGVEYRKKSESTWVRVPESWITRNGGNFNARIIHLEPLTDYVVRTYSGDFTAEELTVTTGVAIQVPNTDFNNWWLDGKIWCPWAEGATPYWGTGNQGATTMGVGQSNSTPTDDTPTGTGKAAMLNTRFVGVSIIGKLAAGNIFTGVYVETEGTNGILDFGREFTERPTKLKGYLKYKSTPISHTASDMTELKGRPDTCVVWVALSDKNEPYRIRTKTRELFNENDPTVIAYGRFQSGSSIEEYTPFEITLDYRATDRKPKYIVIVASASKYGDYFTGGDGSTLWLDDLELVYDY